jgi:hypothetical protein
MVNVMPEEPLSIGGTPNLCASESGVVPELEL